MPLMELGEQSRPRVCSHGKDSPNRLLAKMKRWTNEYTGCDEITEINFIRNFQIFWVSDLMYLLIQSGLL